MAHVHIKLDIREKTIIGVQIRHNKSGTPPGASVMRYENTSKVAKNQTKSVKARLRINWAAFGFVFVLAIAYEPRTAIDPTRESAADVKVMTIRD